MGPDKVKEVTREWTEFPDLEILEFDKAARRYREIVDLEKELKTEKDDLGKDLAAALIITGQKTVAMEELSVISANGRTASYISDKLLLAAGVDADTIAECTVPGTKYSYVQVKLRKE